MKRTMTFISLALKAHDLLAETASQKIMTSFTIDS